MTSFYFPEIEYNYTELKSILFFRTLFAIVLSFSTFIFCVSSGLDNLSQPYSSLHVLSLIIGLSSLVYYLALIKKISIVFIIYTWVILETVFVTAIVFITGSFESIFTFLYLVVIICSSMFFFFKGTLMVATIGSLQYCLIVIFDYFSVITPISNNTNISSVYDWQYIILKVVMVVSACFVVAVLSGMLALRAKKAKQDLKITEGHLKRVERMAAMSEMLSGITHEIKNPLASLSGAIQLLKESQGSGEADYKLFKIVLRETERLRSLINDFHILTKPKTANAVELRVDTTIAEIVELFLKDPQYTDRIHVSMILDDNIFIRIDPVHFKQIIWNLLKNSAEAVNDTGEIFVRLHHKRRERVYIEIEDNGRGIEEEDVRSVFDPFFTTRPDGTGLGLAIVHRLVDKYNGMIGLENMPGQGVIFTLVFEGFKKSH